MNHLPGPVAITAFVLLAACRHPGMPPAIPLPELPPDARIQIRTQSKLERETRSQQVSRTCSEATGNCLSNEVDVDVDVTHRYSIMTTSSGARLNLAQLKVLGDPTRRDKLARLAALERGCHRGNYYLAGLGASLVAMTAISAAGIDQETQEFRNPGVTVAFSATAGAALVFGVLGYRAQFRCLGAYNLYRELDLSREQDTLVVRDGAEELQQLADQFNRRFGAGRAARAARAAR